MSDIDKQLDKILREYFYDDHENCDDSCGKKAYYGELIQAIKQLMVDEFKKLIGKDEEVEIEDEVWREFQKTAPHPFNEYREELRQKLEEWKK